ncbi:regucalcin-like [Cotesia typhae]|uniref:regucalcin-like n=1 Tax=Cotesia typhae TaxID=2053667 RepID=UPI003D684E0A
MSYRRLIKISAIQDSTTQKSTQEVDFGPELWVKKNGIPLTDKGSMYRVNHDGTVAKIIDRVDISNDLVWNHFNDSFYFIDSFAYKIDEYSYNVNFGEIGVVRLINNNNYSNKHTMFDLKKNNLTGIPDGMTIDKAGNLWVANHGGGLVLKIDPKTGRLLQSIKMPVTLVTSVAFGGPNKDILYVTTAKDKLNATQLAKEPLAGSVFTLHNLCVSGSPMRSCVMNF